MQRKVLYLIKANEDFYDLIRSVMPEDRYELLTLQDGSAEERRSLLAQAELVIVGGARMSGEDNKLGRANFKLVEGKNTLGIDMKDINSADDKLSREIHLVVDKPVLLKNRSQDVIHSAYLPHFRVQMNCVPGLTTQFGFTPTQTTAEMKKQEGEDFEYVLLCNKICGAAHYNMQMKFIVETQEEHDIWLSTQKTLKEKLLTQK